MLTFVWQFLLHQVLFYIERTFLYFILIVRYLVLEPGQAKAENLLLKVVHTKTAQVANAAQIGPNGKIDKNLFFFHFQMSLSVFKLLRKLNLVLSQQFSVS